MSLLIWKMILTIYQGRQLTEAPRRELAPEHLIKLVMMLYADSKSSFRAAEGLSKELSINVGMHQGTALSPFLLILVIDEATKKCRGDENWELIYADDLVLTADNKEETAKGDRR